MSEIKIAKRYAKALFDFAKESSKTELINSDMTLMNAVFADSKEFTSFLRNPIVKGSKKMAVFAEAFKGKINDISLKYIEIITKGKRESLLPEISKQYIFLYKESIGLKTATIKTAISLDEVDRKAIIASLIKLTNKKIELNESIDPTLLGGFVLQIDGKQYDASFKSRINKLKKEFETNEFIKQY